MSPEMLPEQPQIFMLQKPSVLHLRPSILCMRNLRMRTLSSENRCCARGLEFRAPLPQHRGPRASVQPPANSQECPPTQSFPHFLLLLYPPSYSAPPHTLGALAPSLTSLHAQGCPSGSPSPLLHLPAAPPQPWENYQRLTLKNLKATCS